MSISAPTIESTEKDLATEIIVSADSHIMEPTDLWVKNLPAGFKGKYPEFPPRNGIGEKPGGWDPKARVQEMAVDGVSAEVLYPTLGLRLFALEDAELQEACFEIANDWLIDYCKVPTPTSSWACRASRCTTSTTPSRSWSAAKRPASWAA